jgi:hypothetical protein
MPPFANPPKPERLRDQLRGTWSRCMPDPPGTQYVFRTIGVPVAGPDGKTIMVPVMQAHEVPRFKLYEDPE